jgi:hypothetical protein
VKDSRDSTTGQIVPDPTKFPDGISGLADKIHAMGLKIGIYSSRFVHFSAGWCFFMRDINESINNEQAREKQLVLDIRLVWATKTLMLKPLQAGASIVRLHTHIFPKTSKS